MKSPFQRRVAIASLLLAPALGACGFNVQTDQVYQAAVGADNRDSTIKVLNAVIVTNGTGQGTFAGSLVNSTGTEDVVTEVTADAVTTVPGGEIVVPSFGLVNLSKLGANGEIPLVLDGDPIAAGRFVTLTFSFASADPVTMAVPVVDNTAEGEDYFGVPLAPAPGEPGTKAEQAEAEGSADESTTE